MSLGVREVAPGNLQGLLTHQNLQVRISAVSTSISPLGPPAQHAQGPTSQFLAHNTSAHNALECLQKAVPKPTGRGFVNTLPYQALPEVLCVQTVHLCI